MRLFALFAAAILALPLVACGPEGSRQQGGTVIGAVAGGIIGNQFGSGTGRALATATGIVVGGLIGSEIGRDLDEADRRAALEAEHRALEYDEESDWRNEESGHYGKIRMRRSWKKEGRVCREYEHRVYIDDEPEIMVGTACRQSDGSWKAVT
jgi:surface antigen